jgi:hypothetical protein
MNADHKKSPAITEELANGPLASLGSGNDRLLSSNLGVRRREKLCFASTRTTTREEDSMAYSLIDRFDSDLMPKYCEGTAALGRLLQEIVVK